MKRTGGAVLRAKEGTIKWHEGVVARMGEGVSEGGMEGGYEHAEGRACVRQCVSSPFMIPL